MTIKGYRIRNQKSLRELAKDIGITEKTLIRAEKGRTVSIKTANKIANYLGETADGLRINISRRIK